MKAPSRAQALAADVERRIRTGDLRAGERLPTVRALAAELGIDPGTAATAYRLLRERGFVVSDGRRGTSVATQVQPRPARARRVPTGVVDLATGAGAGARGPALVTETRRALERVAAGPTDLGRYHENAKLDSLVQLARAELGRGGVDTSALGFVGGTLEGIERVLQAQLRPGDRVGVEDPAFPRLLDLLQALNLRTEPIAVDGDGPQPQQLERALARGLDALIVTPHGQNPFGSSLSGDRAAALARLLGPHDVLVVEDGHGWDLGHRPATLTPGRRRWAVVRSLSRLLGSDIRIAFVAGDPSTIARVEARQAVTTSWVSHLLQEVAAELLASAEVRRRARQEATGTNRRRRALLVALVARGVPAHGRSGGNVWVPVVEEGFAVGHLLDRGYAVLAGERFRLRSGPAVRVAVAPLAPEHVDPLAAALPAGATGRSLVDDD